MCKRRRKSDRESTMVITKVPGNMSKCVSVNNFNKDALGNGTVKHTNTNVLNYPYLSSDTISFIRSAVAQW